MLFRVLNFNEDEHVDLPNLLLITVNAYIDLSKLDNNSDFLRSYLSCLKQMLETEKYAIYKNCKKRDFDQIWTHIYDNDV